VVLLHFHLGLQVDCILDDCIVLADVQNDGQRDLSEVLTLHTHLLAGLVLLQTLDARVVRVDDLWEGVGLDDLDGHLLVALTQFGTHVQVAHEADVHVD